jgi:hypothetical protein
MKKGHLWAPFFLKFGLLSSAAGMLPPRVKFHTKPVPLAPRAGGPARTIQGVTNGGYYRKHGC